MRWKSYQEGLPYIAGVAVTAVLAGAFSKTLGRVGWLATLGTAAFFRDPERVIPESPEAVVAPADGRVSDIGQMPNPFGGPTPMLRIGIFLSVLDVHVNRAPVAGTIKRVWHEEGEFLDARDPFAADKNERRTWLIETCEGRHIAVRQLTGAIARRIVGWKSEGDSLEKGERFGMIRFGSRTEVYLPLDATIYAAVGHKVRGGESVLARLPML